MKKFYDMQATEGSYGNLSNKLQTVYIPTKVEIIKKFNSVECEDCKWMEDDQYTCTTCWCEGGNGTLNVMDCFKKQEGYFYTEEQLKQLLQDYTDIIVENVKISRESTGEGESSDSLISDSFEGDLGYEDYIPVEYTIYKESITNQLEPFLKDLL